MPQVRAIGTLLLFLVLLSGCVSPFTPASHAGPPSTCAELATRGPSGNAPLVPGLRAPYPTIASRIASSFGDSVVGAAEPFADPNGPGSSFQTTEGSIFIIRSNDSAYFSLTYQAKSDAMPSDKDRARASFLTMARNVGIADAIGGAVSVTRDPHSLSGDATTVDAGEVFADSRVEPMYPNSGIGTVVRATTQDSNQGGRQFFVLISSVNDLPNATAQLSSNATSAIATLAVKCILHETSQSAGPSNGNARSFAVVNTSLGERITAYYEAKENCDSAGRWDITVDVVTGTILKQESPSGSCVT